MNPVKAFPPVLIYKTKADYYYHVPVVLTPDKKGLASYPGVKDIYFNGDYAYPVRLHDGFLLDNRGIGPNVAFLTYTYEEYGKLNQDALSYRINEQDPG